MKPTWYAQDTGHSLDLIQPWFPPLLRQDPVFSVDETAHFGVSVQQELRRGIPCPSRSQGEDVPVFPERVPYGQRAILFSFEATSSCHLLTRIP